MNVLASECSSGCESGWTLYLEHSFGNNNNRKFAEGSNQGGGFCGEHYYEEKFSGKESEDGGAEEEEDLSMVSDASSGPPNFNEDEGCYFNDVNGYQYSASKATKAVAKNGGKRQKRKEHRFCEKEKLPSFLDDTASSPVNFSSKNDFALINNNQASMESVLDYSQAQAFSATHFQGRSTFQDHFGFLQPSLSGNHIQNNQWY